MSIKIYNPQPKLDIYLTLQKSPYGDKIYLAAVHADGSLEQVLLSISQDLKISTWVLDDIFIRQYNPTVDSNNRCLVDKT